MVKAITIVFKENVRDEYAEKVQSACECFHGVLEVKQVESDCMDFIAEDRAKHELGVKLLDIVFPKKTPQ